MNERLRFCKEALGLKALYSRSDDLFLTESFVTIFRAGCVKILVCDV